MSTRAEILVLIRIEEGQKAVARSRGEQAVVQYHESSIRGLYARLGRLK